MFNFYKSEDESFEAVFKLNNKITKGLIKNKILKLSDLDNYSVPSSMEDIIPFAERMTGGAKLITDIISEILEIESFLKINKKDFADDYLLGEDFIIVKGIYFTTNPLSNYISKLKVNLKKYKEDEVLFSKIGYIASPDFEILEKELSKRTSFLSNQKLSNLKIEALFTDILFTSQKKNADSFKIIYKESKVFVQYVIEKQLYEEKLINTSIENHSKMIDYLKTFFVRNFIVKEVNGEKLKLTMKVGKTTEESQTVETLNINIYSLNKDVPIFTESFKLPLEDEKGLKQDLSNPYGLTVLSSKRNRKDMLYSLAKEQKRFNPLSKIYFIEKEIEKDFKDIEQFKYSTKEECLSLDFDSYSVVFLDEVDSKKDCEFVYSLISKGKKVFVGVDSPSTIEAFSKLYKWTENKEVLVDNLLSIIQVETLNKVCPFCSSQIQFVKDRNFGEFQQLETAPKMNAFVTIENIKGCESCYQGYKGIQHVAEYLKNDKILKDALLNGFKFDGLKIEKNSSSWFNIFENSSYLIENGSVSTNSIVYNLGYPKKL